MHHAPRGNAEGDRRIAIIWFTSDTHFGHANVLKFSERPWDNIDDMNYALIENINACVEPSDELYILGDFSFKLTVQQAYELRKLICCKKIHLVHGNHDKDWRQPEVANAFIVEPPIKVLKVDGVKIVMSHYPMADWQSMGHGSWHIHGHIHSQGSAYNDANLAQGLLRFDAGVDANEYRPVSLAQLHARFDGVTYPARVKWPFWVNGTGDAQLDAFLADEKRKVEALEER